MSSVAGCSGGSAETSRCVTQVVVTGTDGDRPDSGAGADAFSVTGELEDRNVLVDKPLGLNRLAEAGLPIRGLESLWVDFLGAASTDDCEFPMMAASVGGCTWNRLITVRLLNSPCRSADP